MQVDKAFEAITDGERRPRENANLNAQLISSLLEPKVEVRSNHAYWARFEKGDDVTVYLSARSSREHLRALRANSLPVQSFQLPKILLAGVVLLVERVQLALRIHFLRDAFNETSKVWQRCLSLHGDARTGEHLCFVTFKSAKKSAKVDTFVKRAC